MWKLKTNAQREDRLAWVEEANKFHLNHNLEAEDFMEKQPRNTDLKNYNFEQYSTFTQVYESAMAKQLDEDKLQRQMLRYIKDEPHDHVSKVLQQKLNIKPHQIDNVEDVDMSDFKLKVS